jgi:5-methylcytosine rRNA methyltransferase NSUN4
MKRDTGPTSRGESGFDQFYESIWTDRWPALRASLIIETEKYKLVNPYARPNDEPTSADLRDSYELDPASVLVARALDVRGEHRVLDMCAAPGGKSLVQIFAHHSSQTPTFILNDMSRDRVFRLRRVLQEHLPTAVFEKIKVTARDASRWGVHEKEAYDRVLLDAPCSGERHVLQDAKALREWAPQRSKGLAQRQYALFCSAELVLKAGGRLVYSTCAISPLENDGVIARYFERKGDKARLRRVNINAESMDETARALIAECKIVLEPTSWGHLILPDRSSGAGPMFLSVFEKF